MRAELLAGLLAVSAVAIAGPALAEQTRDVSATYVAGTGKPVPGVYAFSGSGDGAGTEIGDYRVSSGPLAFGANTVGLAVEDGETEVAVSIADVGASTSDELGPICAHYTFHGEDGTHGNGVFAGETTLSLPAETQKVSISIGDSHDPGMFGQGLTDCIDQKGTAGQVHATFR